MKTALLISTYNWPESLELILKSLKNQTQQPDQVLIADDGSTIATKNVINDFAKAYKGEIIHVWHEDKGFRKSKILNKAIAKSSCDYIIQIDGDCIMHPHFIEDHIKNALPNTYLYGTRVTITKKALPALFEKKQTNFHIFSKHIKKRTRTIYLPLLSKLYPVKDAYSSNFRGCNVSYWKSDFIKVNGYNEDFEGWGREDSDLVIRMGNMNVKSRRLRYIAIVYHIYHPENSKANFERNDEIQKHTINNKIIQAEKGISQYLSDENNY